MQFYTESHSIKSLEKARQGYINVIQDIEDHIPGTDSSRVHEEELGRVLCQADNQEQSWHCADRFVYGMDAQKQKALCVGHIVDHQGKGRNDYRNTKKKARKTKDSDFNDKIFLSSKDIIQQTQSIANKMLPPDETPSRIELLQKEYYECMEELGAEGKDFFKEIFCASVLETGKLTNSEIKEVQRLPKENPFRKMMTEMLFKDNPVIPTKSPVSMISNTSTR